MRVLVLFCVLALTGPAGGAVPSEFRDKIGKAAPDFTFRTADGRSHRVKDFRGKWLLLQLGASWCPPSEATATVFSYVRKRLEGRPFEFVEIYDDPNMADVELFSFTPFRGLRSIEGSVPAFYNVGFIPAWYLIAPDGKVRMAGAYEKPDVLRGILAREMGSEMAFRSVSFDAGPAEQAFEKAIEAEGNEDWPAALAAWEQVLAEEPANESALKGRTRAIAWTKGGYPPANKSLRAALEAQPGLHDRIRVFQADYALKGGDLPRGIPLLEALAKAHPESVWLRALSLPFEKPPGEVSKVEAQALIETSRRLSIPYLKDYRAYWLEANGKPDEALKLFHENATGKGQDRLNYAACLYRRGDAAAALAAVGLAGGSYAVETANPPQAWQEMLRHAVVEDWTATTTYARRYREVRPEKVQGHLFELLAALRASHAADAQRLREEIEGFLAASERYKSAAVLIAGEPRRDDFLTISDEHVRFDAALAGILFAEMDGKPDRARSIRREALRAFEPSSWFYAILHGVAAQPR